MDCCEPKTQMLVSACSATNPIYKPSQWVTTHENQGNAIQQVPCPPKKATVFARLTVTEKGSIPATESFKLRITACGVAHDLTICNPLQQKKPLTAGEAGQFWVNSFLADPLLLSSGIYANLVSSVVTATGYTVVLDLVAKGGNVAIETLMAPVNAPVTVELISVGGTNQVKPGMFVSYDVSAIGLSIKPYASTAPYAGFYELPAAVRDSPMMAMRTYGGDQIFNSGGPKPASGCGCASDCSSCGGDGCCTIRRTGTTLVKLSKPIAIADLVGQPILIQDAKGGIIVAAQGTVPAAGSVVVPVPLTFLLNPSSVGSSVVQVTLH
jgi:hypothetical protein